MLHVLSLASSIHHLTIISLTKTLNVVLDCPHQMYLTKFINFFKRNNHGVQTKISIMFMCKISIAFATHKPSIENRESTFDTSTTPPLSLIPLSMPLKISSNIKPMLSRSTSLFLLFCNTERLASSDITSNNNQLLNTPRLIQNQQDLNNLLNFLASQDFPSHLKDQRPNTKWIIECIVSLRIHLIMTAYPLGKPRKLPDYIKNS